MDKNIKALLLFLFFSVLFFTTCLAGNEDTAVQTVNMRVHPLCVIHVTKNPQPLILMPSNDGGELVPDVIDDSTYVQYSSTVGRGQTRMITANWQAGDTAPAGCALMLRAVPAGTSNAGTGNGEIIISSAPQVLITNIRSCATGTHPRDGAQLIYRLAVVNLDELIAGDSQKATIVFTLTDAL